MKYTKERALAVCVQNDTDRNFLVNSLAMYFDGLLKIVPLPLEELADIPIDPGAVMSTHLTCHAVARRFPDSRHIRMKRDLIGNSLQDLMSLPAGAQVLVANAPREAALDTIAAITGLGIDHIRVDAYWPGCGMDVSGYEAVVYTGIKDFCPEGRFNYINIGHRALAIETVVEIIKTFDLPASSATKYYQESITQVTDTCYKLSYLLNRAGMMKASLDKICDVHNSAMFALNDAGELIVFNKAAASFFNMYKKNVLGKQYAQVFQPYPELIELLLSPEELNESMIILGKQHVIVSKNSFFIDSKDNVLVSLLPLEALQQSESKARMKLHSTGFIAKHTLSDILGESEKIETAKKLSGVYAKTNNTVLITGESGTGKEVFAQAIHNASQRAGYPFVGINFAALPESLAESELFGYAEGAFTGASRRGKEGLFEIAHKGTIFFDEIGDASLAVQAKLLRVLEEKEIIRVGGERVIPVDVRIICATNRDLEERMQQGSFRADLYYRIKVLSLHLPPLRERKEDILVIIRGMLKNKCAKMLLEDFVIRRLLDYPWPGNTRELRTIAEYMNMLSDMSYRGASDEEIFAMLRVFLDNNLAAPRTAPVAAPVIPEQVPPEEELHLSRDLHLLLREIRDATNRGNMVGRGSLSRMAALRDAGLTESRIKTRLKYLEKMGLVKVGTTKQGVSLTAKGAGLCGGLPGDQKIGA